GLVELDDDLARTARIEAGIACFGVDFDQDNLIAETPYAESAVSYEKGCFQGQEVLARIRSQGAPSRALVGAEIEPAPDSELTPGSPVLLEDKEKIGYIKSNCSSEFLGRYLALVMIKRDYRTPDRDLEVTIDGHQARLTVRLLPFYERPDLGAQARSLYEEALQEFAREPSSLSAEESRSIALLRQSLAFDPVFEDALEALGVILSKRSSLDQAIETMELLRRLNPDSAMAHTNLSVFWLEKGDKERAEEHKAESMSIRMREAARLAMEEKKQEGEAKAKREETVSRMKMFEQVLEIDGEDLLANYGMGSCLLELDEPERALDYLQKAIEIKPSHTVAYLDLGRALLALDKRKDAAQAWSRGVEVAARRGDMEPLKKMQAHLAAVES
ncbi:MAG: tetratricopeptide repeat protein, partial [Candidatus Obscuribacterales bacterium]